METQSQSNFSIELTYDPECNVFIGISKDIPGLTLEADSIQKFIKEAVEVVPYLLEKNLNITEGEVSVQIVPGKIPAPGQRSNRLKTSYTVSGEAVEAFLMAV